MMKQWFEFDPSQPSPLSQGDIDRAAALFVERASPEQLNRIDALFTPVAKHQFQRILVGSVFALEQLSAHPEWLIQILESSPAGAYDVPAPPQFVSEEKNAFPLFDSALRQWRNQAMVNIIWRDLNRLCSMLDTVASLTDMAELALGVALDVHYSQLAQEFGMPVDANGVQQPLLIIGMGKLGAWELNLSSDVDLIFAYPKSGQTQGAARQLSNQEFFTRLGQRIIKSLDAITRDGFVFRVDMRLRPYGSSGALVSSFDALEDYYQTQGREWERFAMIKARVVASNCKAVAANGDVKAEGFKSELMRMLNHFTYRKYVDYSAIEALRDLKRRINREVQRRRLDSNIKLGRGGIREIEFIVQAFQIIRGGKDAQLQERRVLKVLPLLDAFNCLPEGVHSKLAEAYVFLRDVEHAIQARNDEQTQSLPTAPAAQHCLAYSLGFDGSDDGYQAFIAKLNECRDFVSEQFQAVIAEPEHEAADTAAAVKQNESERHLWMELCAHPDDIDDILQQASYHEAHQLGALMKDLVTSPRVLAMDATGRARLDAFMPELLFALRHCAAPTELMSRLLGLIKAIVRRSAYLLLLTENPPALKQLVLLVQASPWVAQQLAAHPALLDELLNPATLYHVPSKADLTQELRQTMLRIGADDLEQQMEGLRYFRSAHALHVAACEISERLPLMRVSDYLTELAEVLLGYVLDLAWQMMVARHGYPDDVERETPNFVIVGYGKLGGIELGHGSDLDLVFIHDANPQGVTGGDAEGKRSIDNITFYMRLGQKIIHILNTQTHGGQLYEVDMRLRPSGNSGQLVASYNAFERYQYSDAWTWEHQALVRARVIAGDEALRLRVEALRLAVLQQVRDENVLKKDVIEMRQKMRAQLGSSAKQREEGAFSLKQDTGGIVDIEFMVQYAVLAWSHAIPALAHYTDNIRILGCLEDSGQLQTQEVSQLIEAYKAFRSIGHRLALQQHSAIIESSTVEAERTNVMAVWQRLMGEAK